MQSTETRLPPVSCPHHASRDMFMQPTPSLVVHPLSRCRQEGLCLVFGSAPLWESGLGLRETSREGVRLPRLPPRRFPGHGPCPISCPAETRKSLRAVPCSAFLLFFFTFKRNSTKRPGPFMAWCSCLLLEGNRCKIEIAVRLRVVVALLRSDGLLWF